MLKSEINKTFKRNGSTKLLFEEKLEIVHDGYFSNTHRAMKKSLLLAAIFFRLRKNFVHVSNHFMSPEGIEPSSLAPQANTLSVKLWGQSLKF